jgi:NAD-dependent DNA ligase
MNKEELVEKLKSASRKYYNNDPTGIEISDQEFDALVEQLKEKDPDNKFLKEVGAPVLGTVMKHQIPMGSLDKCKNKEEFMRWSNQLDI